MKTLPYAVAIGAFAFVVSTPAMAGKKNSAKVETPASQGKGKAAGEVDEQTKKAIEHFKKGVAFFDKGNFEAAVVEFLASFEIKPAWQLRYNIGVCYAETGRPVDALTQLQKYLDEGGEAIGAERLQEVQNLIAQVKQEIGYIEIAVSEDGARITIDGLEKFVSPVAAPVAVATGFHEIEVGKNGFVTWKDEVGIVSGEAKKIEVTLVAQQVEDGDAPSIGTAPAPVPTSEDEPPKPKWPLKGLWIGLGAGGGLAIAAAIAGGMALSNQSKMQDASDACPNTMTPGDCPSAFDHRDKAKGWMIASDVLWGTAAAAAIAGVVVLVVDKPGKKDVKHGPGNAVGPEVTVSPVLAPGQAGGTLGIEATVSF